MHARMEGNATVTSDNISFSVFVLLRQDRAADHSGPCEATNEELCQGRV